MATITPRTTTNGTTTYRVRWREGGTRTGKWQSATFRRQGDARAFRIAVEAAGHHWPDDAPGAASTPGTITLHQLATAYLDDREARVRSDRTVADYRRDYRLWIQPFFGDRMADEITEADVQAWVDGMVRGTLGRALAPKTAVDRHALLFAIFAYGLAPARRHVDRNPCVGTELPKRQKKAPKGLRPAEWAALHAALQQVNPPAADLALFLLASGWRWSEATALPAYDIEDYGNALYVTMSQVVRRNAAGQHGIVTEGKGEASLRRIQLDDEAAAMVRRRAATIPGNGLVFTTAGGAQWHYANFRRDAWNPAVKLANLDRVPSPHWLRHTAVVWLARSGASLAELQARIGHQNIGTTIGVYGRMLTDVSPVALEGFAALRGASTKAVATTPRAAVGTD